MSRPPSHRRRRWPWGLLGALGLFAPTPPDAAAQPAPDAISRATSRPKPPAPLLFPFVSPSPRNEGSAPGSVPSEETYAVGIVASDEPELPAPVDRNSPLTADQVLAMVRRAMDLIGGMAAVVPDTARLVVIKPNVGTNKPSGSGVNTDARLVRAVALLVHEVAPQARLLIAEGPGGWLNAAYKDCTGVHAGGWEVVDGFATAGHRQTLAELRAQGIDIDCYDLNFDQVAKRVPPGGALSSMQEYELAGAVLEADAWINCPVAKTHGCKITCCLKNQFGLFPGRVYGWNKSRGTDTHPGIPHAPRVMDETFVDLLSLTLPDLNVVDMIAGAEGGAFQGEPKLMNLVLAGRNAVATDLAAALLMGFNPDDFEFADLAWQRGLGPASIDAVELRGSAPGRVASRFKKAAIDYGSEWGEHAAFGMGVRRWTLLGPLPEDHAFTEEEVRALDPAPGQGGWSPVVWFGDDRIDLDKFFDDPTHCAVYAFTRFTMARSDSVRLWVGSDEDLSVWIDGRLVSEYKGSRKHRLGGARLPAFIEAGEHRLLVRAGQTRSRFDFSLNICEPIDDILYAGNRYPGVRYYLAPDQPRAQAAQVVSEHVREDWYSAYFATDLDLPDPVEASRRAPDSLMVGGRSPPGGGDLPRVAAWAAGLDNAGLDSTSLACLSQAPFHLGWTPNLRGWYPTYAPEPGRLLGWLGLRYDIRAGDRYREALKTIQGWLAQGRVPLSSFAQWGMIDGFRRSPDGIALHLSSADTVAWIPVESDWWSPFPGDLWHNCPVVVVEPTGRPLAPQALVDSVAALALDLGLRPWTEDDPELWGTRLFPAGLSAWDAWVIEWERLPLTPEWVEEDDRSQRRLKELGEWRLPELARWRRLASAYFEKAAQAAAGERRQLLAEAAAGYLQVASTLERAVEAFPVEEGPELSKADRARVARLAQYRQVWRQGRSAERRALGALARLLGRPGLPEPAEDPLGRRARGFRVLTWQAGVSAGIYDLVLGADQMSLKYVFGRWPEGQRYEVLAALPQDGDWELAIERLEGDGFYQVLQQPGAANGWQGIVRVDDGITWQNRTRLAVWAVPKN